MRFTFTLMLGLFLASEAWCQDQAAALPDNRASTMSPQPATSQEVARSFSRSGSSLFRAQTANAPSRAPAAADINRSIGGQSYFAVTPPRPRTYAKHDLVTVIVREQSEFKSEGTTELEKDARLQARIDEFLSLDLDNMALKQIVGTNKPRIDLRGSREFNGEGEVERKDSLTARLQAEVVDVKPNGNLVLAARKRLKTDDEVQEFILSGTVRAEDISPDNTVLSTQVYDLNLEKTHTGGIRDSTKRGWMPRFVDWLNPF
jgi:flagellar L-ring protein precursor FlgH